MEHIIRNEGKYPCRGPAFEFLRVLRYVIRDKSNYRVTRLV